MNFAGNAFSLEALTADSLGAKKLFDKETRRAVASKKVWFETF